MSCSSSATWAAGAYSATLGPLAQAPPLHRSASPSPYFSPYWIFSLAGDQPYLVQASQTISGTGLRVMSSKPRSTRGPSVLQTGADSRPRTGDLDLGKIALYQLSYARKILRWRSGRACCPTSGLPSVTVTAVALHQLPNNEARAPTRSESPALPHPELSMISSRRFRRLPA